jgi:hypothetical protein
MVAIVAGGSAAMPALAKTTSRLPVGEHHVGSACLQRAGGGRTDASGGAVIKTVLPAMVQVGMQYLSSEGRRRRRRRWHVARGISGE